MGVTLELDETAVYKNRKKEDKTFVAFELDSVNLKERPWLLSRDLVFARPVDKSTAEPFQVNSQHPFMPWHMLDSVDH